MNRKIYVIAHNIRSTHNVGSIFRTCEGLHVDMLFLSGYTPYPKTANDRRLPHIADKLDRQIHKTALGAESHLSWQYAEDTEKLMSSLKASGSRLVALEQHAGSTQLPHFRSDKDLVLLLGEEVNGVDESLLRICDEIVEIPMYGKKESFNVSVAAAIALYHFRFNA